MNLKKYPPHKWINLVRNRIFVQKVPKRILNKKNSFDAAILVYCSKMNLPHSNVVVKGVTPSDVKNKDICKGAQYILDNKLPLLSDNIINLGEKIAWNKDYITNIECSSIEQAKSEGADIKRVWELSRMHQISPLMNGFFLTGNAKYLEKIKDIINSWIKDNPYEEGPNWINSMEIAIRSANIIRTIVWCPELSEDKEFLQNVNQLLFWSGVHIQYHLENTTLVNNNHYLSNLMGLVFIGAYFQDCDDKKIQKLVKKWIGISYKELNKEIREQVLDDGTSFEKSTSYHAYVLEILLWSYKVFELNTDFDIIYLKSIIHKMYIFLNQIEYKEGIPFIGDNDNSRLFRDDKDYPFEDQHKYEMLLENCRKWLDIKDNQYKTCYINSGYYFLNSDSLMVLVCCGALSKNGGHCHNDQLSFILWYKGIRITDDPGTYCYTSDLKSRNIFRGTKMHSTVQICDAEQNEFAKCFEVKERSNAECIFFNQESFEGVHYGYKNQFNSVVKRRIKISGNRVNIYDSLQTGNNIEAISRIIFSPDVVLNNQNLYEKDGINFYIEVPENNFNVTTVLFSPSYGIQKQTLAIEIPFMRQIEYSIIFMEGETK